MIERSPANLFERDENHERAKHVLEPIQVETHVHRQEGATSNAASEEVEKCGQGESDEPERLANGLGVHGNASEEVALRTKDGTAIGDPLCRQRLRTASQLFLEVLEAREGGKLVGILACQVISNGRQFFVHVLDDRVDQSPILARYIRRVRGSRGFRSGFTWSDLALGRLWRLKLS